MSVVIKLSLAFLVLISLAACSHQKVDKFDKQVKQSEAIVKNAKTYTDEQYQNGEVALHEDVQIKGKITKTDEQDGQVKKDSRFILKTAASQYQVINGTDSKLQTGDIVTVYGEYYGFIKAMQIEREENDND